MRKYQSFGSGSRDRIAFLGMVACGDDGDDSPPAGTGGSGGDSGGKGGSATGGNRRLGRKQGRLRRNERRGGEPTRGRRGRGPGGTAGSDTGGTGGKGGTGGGGGCDLSGDGKPHETLPADITHELTLTSDTVWDLDGFVKVHDGAVLTIEACTRIEGSSGTVIRACSRSFVAARSTRSARRTNRFSSRPHRRLARALPVSGAESSCSAGRRSRPPRRARSSKV